MGGGAPGLAVVVAGEELAEEPRQRGMDREVGRAKLGEKAGVSGAFEQAGEMLLAPALQFRHGMLAGFAHQAQDIDIHRPLEEMKKGDDGEFVVLERVAEAVVERGSEGLVAALLFVGILYLLLAAADGFDEVRDSLLSVQARSDRLTYEHTQRERVAGTVIEQRLPVGDLRALEASLFAQLEGEASGVGIPHAWHLNAMRETAEPGVFVPAGGEDDFYFAGGVELKLLEKVAELALFGSGPLRFRAFREAGNRLDIVPNPEDGERAKDTLDDLQAFGRIILSRPINGRIFQERGEWLAYLVQQVVEVCVALEGGEQDQRLRAQPAGDASTNGRTRRPLSFSPAPRRRVVEQRGARRKHGPVRGSSRRVR